MRERVVLRAREAGGRTDFAAFLADFVLLAIVDVLLTSNCLSMRPFRDAEFKPKRKQKLEFFLWNQSKKSFFLPSNEQISLVSPVLVFRALSLKISL